jgi:hypothetical protein
MLTLSSAPLEKGSKCEEVVLGIRKRKGLKVRQNGFIFSLAHVYAGRNPPSGQLLRQAVIPLNLMPFVLLLL